MPKYIIEDIKISSDESDKQDSDKENPDEKNSDKKFLSKYCLMPGRPIISLKRFIFKILHPRCLKLFLSMYTVFN